MKNPVINTFSQSHYIHYEASFSRLFSNSGTAFGPFSEYVPVVASNLNNSVIEWKENYEID